MKSLRLTLPALIAGLITAAPAGAAPPHPYQGLSWLAGEIRGQVAEVEARAQLVLPFCDDAEDVRDELAQLVRDLDRFEQRLAVGVHHHNDVSRLARLAERVCEHADELKEEIADAIEDLQEDGRILRFHGHRGFHRANNQQPARSHSAVHYVGLDLDDLEDELEDRREEIEERREERREAIEEYYDDLEDRLDDNDFRRGRFAPRGRRAIDRHQQQHGVSPWGASPRVYRHRAHKPRGVRVTIGRFGPRFSFSSGGVKVVPKLVLPPPPVALPPVAPPAFAPPVEPIAGVPWQQVLELKASVGRLHALARQLRRSLCG